MEEKDYIKDLFSKKLGNAEAPVNPDLWTSISSNLVSSSVVSTGIGLTTKWLIGVGIASASVLTVALILDKDAQTKSKDTIVAKIDSEKSPKDNIGSTKVNVEENKTFNTKASDFIENTTEVEKIKVNSNDFVIPFVSIDSYPKSTLVLPSESSELSKKVVDALESKPENKIIVSSVESSAIETKKEESSLIVKEVFIGDLPNVFTPNNDRDNDLFFIESRDLEDFVLTIMNSKNEVVYKTDNANFKWDGKDFSSMLVPVGSYIYFFTAKDSKGNPISKYSSLEIRY